MSNIDEVMEINNTYNPRLFKYADNDRDGIWLYDALTIPLGELLHKARSAYDVANVYAICEYMWAPVSIAD